jgi:hypothetical protein
VKAIVKDYDSPQIDDFETFEPEDPENFSFGLTITVGAEGEQGEDLFDLFVCTPKWLETNRLAEIVPGRHHLIVYEYNFPKIAQFIEAYVGEPDMGSWEELASYIARLAHWEFEDYDETPVLPGPD